MPSGTNTPKLDLLRIQETWQFGDGAFNRFIDDADNKLVGVAHLQSPMHWTEWKPETVYVKGDVVRYPNLKSHQYAACLVGGTSDVEDNIPENNITGSIIDDNTVKWEVCSLTESDPNGGTIRIWLAGTYYRRGDAVRYGDALYRAKVDHQASNNFGDDENWWQEIYASIRFWKPNTYYYLDDTAIYDDIIYKCIRAHKSVANFETVGSTTGDEDDWEIIGGAGGAKDWQSDTKYQYGQLVLVHGILYRCNTKHRSSNTFSSDIVNWDLVDAQIHDWQTSQYYVAGTLVAYNNIIYKCLTSHTSSANFETDIANWVLYHNHITVWDRNKSYYQGQIILYENRLYKCNITHVSPNEITENAGQPNETTRNATFLDDISNFDVIYASLAVWAKNTVYKVGDTILYNNEQFRCVKNHTSGNTNTSTIFDNITDNVSTNCWEYIGTKNAYIFPWNTDTNYNVNQFVTYNNTLYKCNTLHKSTSTFDATKWDLVYANIQPWTTGLAYKVNSAVLNDGHLYLCITAHTSTVFNDDMANWIEIGGEAGIKDWVAGKSYIKDTVVLYNGILYRNNAVHTSASTFANDITYWDIVYSSIPTWTTNKYYPINMIVSYNNLTYKCVSAHTASADFNTDIANWILFNNSITTWSASTMYKAGQVVLYDGVLYVCNVNHISASSFDVTKWDFAYSNIRQYANNTIYKAGSEVIYNKDIYRCKENHTSNTDTIKYHNVYFNDGHIIEGNEYITSLPIEQTIDMGQSYDIVHMYMYEGGQYSGLEDFEIWGSTDGTNFTLIYHYIQSGAHYGWTIQFDCLATARYLKFIGNHYQGGYESGSASHSVYLTNLKVGIENPYWDRIGNYLTTILDWQSGYFYHPNDIVMHGGELYRCTTLHLSSDFTQDLAYWESVNSVTSSSIPDWQASTQYLVDYVVSYNDNIYRCNTIHTSSSTFNLDDSKWDIIYTSIKNWVTSVYYKVGTVVVYNGLAYKCTTAHTSSASFNTDIANWVLLDNSIATWAASTAYKVGQIVLYDGVEYRCNTSHISTSTFDVTKWDLVYANIRNFANNTIYKAGSIVIGNNNIYRCLQNHTSNTDNIKYHIAYTDTSQMFRVDYYISDEYMPHEDIVDLGEIMNVEHIYIEQSGYFTGISDLDIAVSLDGINYTVVYNYNNPNANVYRYGTIPMQFYYSGRVRYIKLIMHHMTYETHEDLAAHFWYTNLKVSVTNPYWELVSSGAPIKIATKAQIDALFI